MDLRCCAIIKSYAITSLDELQWLLEGNEFEMDSLNMVVHQGWLKDGQAGAGANRSAERADFVAVCAA